MLILNIFIYYNLILLLINNKLSQIKQKKHKYMQLKHFMKKINMQECMLLKKKND